MSEFCYEIVKNPEIFQENRLDAHSDHEYYSCEAAAVSGISDFKYSLNGVWKFMWAKNYESCLKDFAAMDIDCHRWDTIRVPAHIQMEGYGHPQYVNVQYPWDGSEAIVPGQIPEVFNPVASYVKYFRVPATMSEKRVLKTLPVRRMCSNRCLIIQKPILDASMHLLIKQYSKKRQKTMMISLETTSTDTLKSWK